MVKLSENKKRAMFHSNKYERKKKTKIIDYSPKLEKGNVCNCDPEHYMKVIYLHIIFQILEL